MRLGLYLRISIDQGDATERQAESCRMWAERNGHEIVEVYEDRETGYKKGVRREAFERLLLDAGPRFDGILCWRIDRLLRNWRDWARLDDLLDKGVVVLTEDGTDSRRDGAILAIKVAFAKEESRRIGERLRNKLEAQARAGLGRSGGNRPFGYTRQWQVVPEEAVELKRAVSHILAGGSANGVVRDWNKRGILTTTGKQWSISVLRNMLLRPSLAGLRPHNGVLHEAAWEPLITREQHESLKILLHRPKPWSTIRVHWASGLVACSLCGQKMYVQRNAYICRCRRCSMKVEYVERAIFECMVWLSRQSPHAPQEISRDLLEAISNHELRLKRATDALTDGLITPTEYKEQRERILPQIRELRLQMLPKAEFDAGDWLDKSATRKAEIARSLIRAAVVSPPGRGAREYRPESIRILANS